MIKQMKYHVKYKDITMLGGSLHFLPLRIIDKGGRLPELSSSKFYEDKIISGEPINPIAVQRVSESVFPKGILYRVVDGFHRYSALEKLGIKSVKVEIVGKLASDI